MFDETLPVKRRTVMQGTGAALTASALSTVGAAEATERQSVETDGADVVAHRGFAGLYPENTVAAVAGSARQGADMVEVDIMPCADGTVVVFHDNRLSSREDGGLTDAEGVVWETACETVLGAHVLGTDETVPTLSEIFEALPSSVGVNIEFKNPGSKNVRFAENLSGDDLDAQRELWLPLAEKALNVAGEYRNKVLVSSFYEGALAAVREVDDSVPIAFLFWDSIEEGLAITREYDAEALHPPWNMIKGTPFFGDEYYTSGPFADVDLVEEAHSEGRTVNTWTVQTWYQAEQLQQAGVDGLIADYPGLADASSDRGA